MIIKRNLWGFREVLLGIWDMVRSIFTPLKYCVCCNLPLDINPPRKMPKYLRLCCSCRMWVEYLIIDDNLYKQDDYGVRYTEVNEKQKLIAGRMRKINQRLREFQNLRDECST